MHVCMYAIKQNTLDAAAIQSKPSAAVLLKVKV